MKTALIGYTGFVGSNIVAGQAFDDVYNTSNLQDIAGKEYDLVVSAANRADSFRINENPEADLAEIDAFAQVMKSVSIKKVVLISTVCVYEASDESDEDTPISTDNITPYGQNRRHLELLFQDWYDTTILRLPQLFGTGLKKGVIYDLANDYRVEHIRPNRQFQYYGLNRLWSDISIALTNGLSQVNLATPPLSNETVARECFGRDISQQALPFPESHFSTMYTRNMTTKHAALFGGVGKYLMSEQAELESIKQFVHAQDGLGSATQASSK